jgi:hypothetical protein
VTIAQESPRLVILRCTEVIRPETVTGAVGPLLVDDQLADRAVGALESTCSRPLQRVVGDVEAEHLALVAEQGHLVPLVDVGDRDVDAEAAPEVVVVEPAEQRVLADRLVALDVDVLVDGRLVDRTSARAVASCRRRRRP